MSVLGLLLLPLFALSASARLNPIVGIQATSPLKNEIGSREYLLPTYAVPELYKIELAPVVLDTETFPFTGKSQIQINVKTATNTLILHAKGLTIDNKIEVVEQCNKKDCVKATAKFYLDTLKDFLILNLDKEIKPGKYDLFLSFSGTLNENLYGFYRSSYKDDKGNKRYLATTHFEPSGARLAFPCWDEPAIKAEYQISLIHPESYHALSNMPVEGARVPVAGTKNVKTNFKKTKKMSSYLVAFVVSDYAEVGEGKFKVYSRPNAIDTAKYALEMGKKELNALDKFTKLPYMNTFEKLDQISIPDFDAGAMENWGLVTYRESHLLYDDKVTTTAGKQRIASVISHEFAHQWFGNLVSPQWWKYLWLNEGFASYFEYFTTGEVETSWRLMDQFVVKSLQGSAFIKDASQSTRPMSHDAYTHAEIKALFDTISYQKAACVIRMMSHIVSEDVFKDGLTTYLKNNQYGVATPELLFESIQTAINKAKDFDKDFKIATIMDPWVNKGGYPVVNVKRNPKTGKYEISQKQFSVHQVNENNKWNVPLNFATEEKPEFDDTKPTMWLNADDKEKEVELVKGEKWVIANKQQTGYYRVNYDNKNWELLAKFLKSKDYKKIHVLNRAQLIDDAFNLARVGQLDYPIALSLISYLDVEVDYIPWVSAFRGLSFLNRMLVKSKEYDTFKGIVKEKLKNMMEETRLAETKDDTHVQKLARVEVQKWACEAGVEACVTEVEEKLKLWLEDASKNPLDKDLKSNILCAGLRNAKEDTWEKVFDVYKKSTDTSEQTTLLVSLGCSNNADILKKYMQMALEEKSDIKHFPTAFKGVLTGSPLGVDLAMDTLAKNYEKIKSMVKESELESFLVEIGSRVSTNDQYIQFGSFVSRAGFSNAQTTDGLLNAGANINWVNTYQGVVENWLDSTKKVQTAGATTTTVASFLIFLPVLVARFY